MKRIFKELNKELIKKENILRKVINLKNKINTVKM